MKNTYCDENCFECKRPDCTIPDKFLRLRESKCKQVVLISETGKEIVFPSCKEAASFCGVSNSIITKRLKFAFKSRLTSKKDAHTYQIKFFEDRI